MRHLILVDDHGATFLMDHSGGDSDNDNDSGSGHGQTTPVCSSNDCCVAVDGCFQPIGVGHC